MDVVRKARNSAEVEDDRTEDEQSIEGVVESLCLPQSLPKDVRLSPNVVTSTVPMRVPKWIQAVVWKKQFKNF